MVGAIGEGDGREASRCDRLRDVMAFVFSPSFPTKPTYRIGEVALALGVHVTTVRRWTDEGRLDCIRLGAQRRLL